MNERIKNYELLGDDKYLVTVEHQCSPNSIQREIATTLNSYRVTSGTAQCPDCNEKVIVKKDLSQAQIIYLAPTSIEPQAKV